MASVYVGLGSNLGDRLENLRFGINRLAEQCKVAKVSSLYETEPIGPPQPNFYNAVCRAETELEPLELLSFLKRIEREAGRDAEGPRWGPRLLDLDIVLYDDEIIDVSELVVPHSRLAERAFVLAPLCELAPELRHPRSGKSMRELLASLGRGGVQLIMDETWAEQAISEKRTEK